MLVKIENPSAKTNFKNTWTYILLLLVAVILIFIFSSSWSFEKEEKQEIERGHYITVAESDLENIYGEYFSKEGRFRGTHLQSTEKAHSGKYSIRLSGDNQYGLEFRINNPVKKHKYCASVWTYSSGPMKGVFAVSSNDTEVLYKQNNVASETDKKGWGLIQIYFIVPSSDTLKYIKIYAYVGKNADPVYFDDIKIERIDNLSPKNKPSGQEKIFIEIGQDGYSKLMRKKKKAYEDGILISADDDWVKASITNNNSEFLKAKVRLKGDWLDHLKAEKWSLRVKLKDPYSWNGLMTLSIQTPAARLFLKEWVFHQLLLQEDILAPRYGFLRMFLNNSDRGIYAFEEHFDKQLVESNSRREGPILKLSEDFLWLKYKRKRDLFGNNRVISGNYNSHNISEIRAFKENRFEDNEILKKNFEIGQSLLYGYLTKALSGSDVFDIEKMAKYYALVDLNKAYHGNAWHNQRFYYNPVISKFEPIGYDGFGSAETKLGRGPFLGYYNGQENSSNIYIHLFREKEFCRKYNYYLDKYSESKFLNKFSLSIEEDLLRNLELINQEFKDYTFELEDMLTRGKELQFYLRGEDDLSLHVKTEKIASNNKEISCTNVHYLSLDIVGYTYSDKSQVFYFDEPIFLSAMRPRALSPTLNISVPKRAKRIVFTVAGISDREYHSDILSVSGPKIETPRLKMEASSDLTAIAFAITDSVSVMLQSGRHTMDRDLIIPPGKSLVLLPGTQLDVVNGAAIIVNGSVQALGTPENPIELVSSDHTAQGFTVIQSTYRSILKNVLIKDFNTLDRDGWTLTGAVTFYEADVDMVDCTIINAHCEDGLNTVRSDIDIQGLYIAHTFSDGFDSDFCTGTIDRAIFESTGNDAMDISGSELTINNCKIFKAGDKGISVGENANVRVLKLSIEDSNIGLASKDLSYLEVQNVSLKNCKQGFALYQKKPEFGPARMNIRYHVMKNVKQAYLIEKGSELRLQDKVIFGE